MIEKSAQRDQRNRSDAVDPAATDEREEDNDTPRAAPTPRARSPRSRADARPGRERPPAREEKQPAKPRAPAKDEPAGKDEATEGLWASLRGSIRQHPYAAIAIAIVFLLLCVAGVVWWLHARNYQSTDDAFVDARIVPISSQIAGAIVDLPVTDNQFVKQGGALLKIDPRDYQAALDQAKAQAEQAEATIANLGAQIDAQQPRIQQANRQVAEAKATLEFSKQENARAQDLVKTGAGTVERAQQTASDVTQKQAAADAAIAELAAEEKQIRVLQTQQQAAKAQLDQAKAQQEVAEANLSRTTITAPVDGMATKITAAKGAYAQAGQTVMMFVPSQVWITANFKETQLTLMRPGQPVEIEIDAYPGKTFKGHVDSIQAGSGAAFSLLPPENATGNYVKVVQRVPVKIVFDGPLDVYVGPGMSVVPTVKVR